MVNTRPREQAAELSRLLAAAGFEVLEAPAIATVPAWNPEELAAVRGNLASGGYAWIVLPSHNAARDLVDNLRHGRVVCGAATAQALGLKDALTLDRFSAAAALELLRPLVRPGARILVPRAAESRDELTDGLVALGTRVHAPIALPHRPRPSTLRAGRSLRLSWGLPRRGERRHRVQSVGAAVSRGRRGP